MEVKEKDIADLLYRFPWLLDNRFVIPDIYGNLDKGRKVNIGRNGFCREIELLFKDTRDNRPVIVEIKKDRITRDDVARILEYRSLVTSMDEGLQSLWRNEFEKNYFAPKMIVVGMTASEEVVLSANLAGIELRLLKGTEVLEVSFAGINRISEKLDQWDSFLKSGNRTIIERHKWVERIFEKIKSFVDNYGNDDISTIGSLCKTSLKNSYVRGQAFPFINIPIRFQDKELLGFYEYFSDELCFDDQYIYCDFIIEHSYYALNKDEETMNKIVAKAEKMLQQMGYNIVAFDSGMATVKIERRILEQDNELVALLQKLLDDAIAIQNEIALES